MDSSSTHTADHPVLIVSDDPAGSGTLAGLLPALRDAIGSSGGPAALLFPVPHGGPQAGPAGLLRTGANDAGALVIITEVRNNSCSGEIALALDQLRDGPVRRKPIGLVSVGAGQSTHAVDHLRVVLAALDAVVIPQSLSVSGDGPDSGLGAPALRRRIGGFVDELLWYAARLQIDAEAVGGAGGSVGIDAQQSGGTQLRSVGHNDGDDSADPVDEDSVSTRIDDAVSFIRENYASHTLTLDLAARAAFMSKYHFSRTFKKHIGRRFIDFVTDLRMERASSLLLETDLPVADICDRVGYRDISHFQRTFRTAFATSPSAYRHAAQ